MDWFEILKGVRNLCKKKDSFTAFDLNGEIGFPADSEKASHRLASAWVCKFVSWGYVTRVGTKPNPGHKPVTLYALTEKGRDAENLSSAKETETQDSDLDELRYAVRAFEEARNARINSIGKKTQKDCISKEDETYAALIELCNKLDCKEFGVE